MIELIIASIPIEVESYSQVHNWEDVNRAAQISTKETFPWWWDKYGCEGTQWYPEGEQCRDLTNEPLEKL